MLCVILDGRGAWGRMDTYICMAELLDCPPETIIILLICSTPVKKKSLKIKKKLLVKSLHPEPNQHSMKDYFALMSYLLLTLGFILQELFTSTSQPDYLTS